MDAMDAEQLRVECIEQKRPSACITVRDRVFQLLDEKKAEGANRDVVVSALERFGIVYNYRAKIQYDDHNIIRAGISNPAQVSGVLNCIIEIERSSMREHGYQVTIYFGHDDTILRWTQYGIRMGW